MGFPIGGASDLLAFGCREHDTECHRRHRLLADPCLLHLGFRQRCQLLQVRAWLLSVLDENPFRYPNGSTACFSVLLTIYSTMSFVFSPTNQLSDVCSTVGFRRRMVIAAVCAMVGRCDWPASLPPQVAQWRWLCDCHSMALLRRPSHRRPVHHDGLHLFSNRSTERMDRILQVARARASWAMTLNYGELAKKDTVFSQRHLRFWMSPSLTTMVSNFDQQKRHCYEGTFLPFFSRM